MDNVASNSEWRITFPIEKAEERGDGLFITGLASGPEVDAQGDRMDARLIHKFADQINATGNLPFVDRLPYRDAHSKDGVLRDLGVASKAWVNDQGRLGVEVQLDEDNPAARYLFKQISKGKQYGMSVHGHVFGFVDEFVQEIGKTVRTYKDVLLDEISNTTRPAWTPSLGSVLSKALEDDDDLTVEKAVWTGSYIDNLPDSAFAYIEPGGKKDASGKTTPRELRHLPYKDATGKNDAAHVRNALARLPQTQISDSAKAEAKAKLLAAAKELGIETAQKDDDAASAVADVEGASVTDGLNHDTQDTEQPAAPETPVETAESAAPDAPEAEKSDSTEEADALVIEKAGATLSAATKQHLLAMHHSAQAHLAAVEAEMKAMGMDAALGIDEEKGETTPDNESTEKSDSQDDQGDTLSKTDTETPEPTVLEKTLSENEELKKSVSEMTARIQSLEANRTVLPPVIDRVEKDAEDLQKDMAELPVSARLRVAFAAHTKGA